LHISSVWYNRECKENNLVAIVKEKFEAVFKNIFKPLSNLTKYQYDLAGSLTKADHVHNEDHDEEFIYDGAYRLTQYYKDANDEENRVSQDWTVDGVYNWTEFTDYGTTEDRLYDSVNELTAINTNNDADFLYDKNGNLTEWTDDPNGQNEVIKEFLWDDLNRLTKIVVDSNDEAIFIYDVNNQRVRKEYDSDDDGDIDVNDETIEYVWSDGHVIEEYVDGSIDRNYVHGNMFIDELILFDDGSNVHYYLQDFRYSVYALVNNQGTNEEEYRFDPYGKRTVVTDDGSIDEHYGFTGRYHDDSDETDLIYFRNRWMSAEVGRFVSRDPVEYWDGMNLYAWGYISNSLDPFGLYELVFKDTEGGHQWVPGQKKMVKESFTEVEELVDKRVKETEDWLKDKKKELKKCPSDKVLEEYIKDVEEILGNLRKMQKGLKSTKKVNLKIAELKPGKEDEPPMAKSKYDESLVIYDFDWVIGFVNNRDDANETTANELATIAYDAGDRKDGASWTSSSDTMEEVVREAPKVYFKRNLHGRRLDAAAAARKKKGGSFFGCCPAN